MDSNLIARRVLGSIDLTDLAENSSVDAVIALCGRARGRFGHTAAVCVWPRFVATAVAELDGSPVTVATVVNFPQGGTDVASVLDETIGGIADGAHEIDVVLPYRALLAGDTASARRMVDAVRVACGDALLKVILETGELVDLETVAAAARLAIDHGADFVKTSTGKTPVSATLPAARTMLDEIARSGRSVGIKPSGGIRTLADAAAYLLLADEVMGDGWATPSTFRLGASGLLDAVEAELSGGPATDADEGSY
jgi:deoxyribose-phosphate aldolase